LSYDGPALPFAKSREAAWNPFFKTCAMVFAC